MNTKRVNTVIIIIGLLLSAAISEIQSQDLKDVDGNSYRIVNNNSQEWTGINLNVSHFRNGDVIPEAKTEEEWITASKEGKPAWCFYENDPANGEKYGKLFNWFAINDPRGLAPEGWHVAIGADWSKLVKSLLGVDYAGQKLKSSTEWKKRKGIDKIGFSGIPAGVRDIDGKFRDLGKICQWWSNTVPLDVIPSNKIFSVLLNDLTPEVRFIQVEKGMGLSIRCVRDSGK